MHNISGGISQASIYRILICTKLVPYLRKGISMVIVKRRVAEEQFDKIGWNVQENAMIWSKIGHQQWISKYTSRWCATGEMMRVWGKRVTSTCPRFNAPVEDNTYMLRCQSEGALI